MAHDRPCEPYSCSASEEHAATSRKSVWAQHIWHWFDHKENRRVAGSEGGALPRRRSSRTSHSRRNSSHSCEREITRLNSIKLDELLGEGAFAKVHHAVHKSTGKELAVKVIPTGRESDVDGALREAELNRRLTEPHRLPLLWHFMGHHEDCFSHCLGSFVSESHRQVCLVFDVLKGGDMCQWSASHEWPLPEHKAKIMVHRVLQGVAEMHRRRIVHCDLKLANLMLEDPEDVSSVKIVDFGLAEDVSKSCWLHSYTGTPQYWAPEIVSSYKRYKQTGVSRAYGPQVDVWSVGVIMYQLISGSLPFDAQTADKLMPQIMAAEIKFQEKAWLNVSASCLDIVSKLLHRDYTERLTAKQALKHPWFKDLAHK